MTEQRIDIDPCRKGDTIGMAIVHGMLLCAVVAVLLLVVPRFEKMFVDLGVDLPLPTRVTLVLSRFLQTYWFSAFPLLAGVWVADVAVYYALHPADRRGVSTIWSGAVLLLFGLWMLISTVSLFLPIIGTIEAIGSAAHGG